MVSPCCVLWGVLASTSLHLPFVLFAIAPYALFFIPSLRVIAHAHLSIRILCTGVHLDYIYSSFNTQVKFHFYLRILSGPHIILNFHGLLCALYLKSNSAVVPATFHCTYL